jgi:hypothetical protein
MDLPWNRARDRRSQRQEQRNAAMPEGSQQPNSGRFWRFKRDNKVWNFLVESRTTEKGSYSVSKKEFESIRREAISTPPGLKPGMQIDLGNLSLFVMELRDFEALYTRVVDLEARLEEEDIP